MKRKQRYEAQQSWFWTDEWQAGEKEASEDIAAGRVERFNSSKEFLHWIIYDHKRDEAIGGASGADAEKWAKAKATELNAEE